MTENRYREYRDLHQCSLQEAKRVLDLEDRLKVLRQIHSDLGECYDIQVVADKVRALLDVLIIDAETEYRR